MDSVLLVVQQDGPHAMRMQFSWKQGFLTANKPPICWQTPMLRQHCCISPATNRHSNTPSTVPVVDNPTSTMAQLSTQSLFLQHYNLHLQLCGVDGAFYSEWESITNFLLQLQELDDTIALLQWATKIKTKVCQLPLITFHSLF